MEGNMVLQVKSVSRKVIEWVLSMFHDKEINIYVC